MAIENINTGTRANDGTGESIKTAFDKVNSNFDQLIGDAGLINTAVSEAVGAITSTFVGGEITGDTLISSTTNSSNPTSGALTIVGGLGVGGDATFAYEVSAPTVTAVQVNATAITVGSLAITGGINDTAIGQTVPAPGTFSSLSSVGTTSLDTLLVAGTSTFTNTITTTGLTSSGNISAPNVSVTSGIAGTTLTLTGTASTNGLTSTGPVEATTITATNGLSADAITITTGNLNLVSGGINGANTIIRVAQSIVGFAGSQRLLVGTEGGDPTVGAVNFATIYTQDGELVIKTNTIPTSATDTGTEGEIRIGDDSGTTYLYRCIATDTWVRVALATW